MSACLPEAVAAEAVAVRQAGVAGLAWWLAKWAVWPGRPQWPGSGQSEADLFPLSKCPTSPLLLPSVRHFLNSPISKMKAAM